MNKNTILAATAVLFAGVSCQQASTSLPTSETVGSSPSVVRVDRPSGEGWKEIVPGYWVKTEEYMGGPLVTTYIDNSSKEALEYERTQYLKSIQGLKANGLYPQDMKSDYYLNYLNEAMQNSGNLSKTLSPLYTCTSSPAFSVGPYNNGSYTGVVSYVSGSCTNGGRASAK